MKLMTKLIAVSMISAIGISHTVTKVWAAAPTITNERVQLRTLANGDIVVNVSATVEDTDGLGGIRVTVTGPGNSGPFPMQPGLYRSPTEPPFPAILTVDGYTVPIGVDFILPAQRAGDYVITADDGTAQASKTVTLPAGLVALAAGGVPIVDPTTDFGRPRITIPAISGAGGYRVTILNDSDSTSITFDGVAGPDLSSSPSIRINDTNRLTPGKFYRLSIDAFDALQVALSGLRSESDEICYDPATGRTDIPCLTQKDVHLVTESNDETVMLTIGRVLDRDDLAFLKNPPPTNPPTVPVTVSRGNRGPFQLTSSILVNVDTDSDVTDQFTSARNPLDITQIPLDQRPGDYNFRAQDSSGNVVTVTRNFPSAVTPLSAPGPLNIDPTSGALTPTVSIAPVPGASNYRVVVFNDTDSTRKNFDNLPGGTLSEKPTVQIFPGVIEANKFYRIHMDAFNAQTFSTTTARSRSQSLVYDPSGLDIDGDGIQSSLDRDRDNGFTDQSNVTSNKFTNEHLGGNEFGTIIDRADLDVIVVEPPDTVKNGIRIGAGGGGSGTAQVNACLPTVIHNLTERDAEIVDCGSLRVEVLDGTIEYLLGANSVVIAPGGARLTIHEPIPGQYTVENTANSFVPVTLVTNGEAITVPAGSPGVSLPVVKIKPGDGPNCVNPKSKGVIPIAILGGAVDVRTIVQSSLEIGGDTSPATAGVKPETIAIKDVNGDGVADLIMQFKTQAVNAAGLLSNGRRLYVTGLLNDGKLLLGSDTINLADAPVCN